MTLPHRASRISRSRDRLRARPPEALTLGLLLLAAAVSLGIAVVNPMSDDAPVALGAALIPVALLLGAGTIALGNRLTPAGYLTIATVTAVLNGVIVARSATSGGAMVDGLAYFWLTVYVAAFFPAAAPAFTALILTCFGVGLVIADIPSMLSPYLVTSLSMVVATVLVVRLSRAVRLLVEHDVLTGTLNRGALLVAARREIGGARRRGESLAVVAVDLDGFKLVNDRDGHAAGDRVLTDVAAAWRTTLRAQDVLGRMGGDEFVLLLPDTDEQGAAEAVARMRAAHDAQWSAGIAVWAPDEAFETTLERADARLYAAKRPIRAA